MRLTRRQRKDRKARGLSVEPRRRLDPPVYVGRVLLPSFFDDDAIDDDAPDVAADSASPLIVTNLETLNRLREMSGFERVTAQDLSFFASKADERVDEVPVFCHDYRAIGINAEYLDFRAIPIDLDPVSDAQLIRDVSAARPLWTPRHGGGATLTVGGEVIAEIEPMGGGWWVGVGDGDLVNGTLQEAKVRALEMLSGVSP